MLITAEKNLGKGVGNIPHIEFIRFTLVHTLSKGQNNDYQLFFIRHVTLFDTSTYRSLFELWGQGHTYEELEADIGRMPKDLKVRL